MCHVLMWAYRYGTVSNKMGLSMHNVLLQLSYILKGIDLMSFISEIQLLVRTIITAIELITLVWDEGLNIGLSWSKVVTYIKEG